MGYSEHEIDIMHKCLELINTVGQGLQYVQKQLALGQYEQGMPMLSEVIDGCLAIERGLSNLEDTLLDKPYWVSQENMVVALERTGEAASEQKWMQCNALLEELLLPAFNEWQMKLRQILEPALAS